MNENVQLLMLAKKRIDEGFNGVIFCAICDVYYSLFAKHIAVDHPILVSIDSGLDGYNTLSSWLYEKVPNCPELTGNTRKLCSMAWIDKLMEEFAS